jgi:hypothetical protein
MFWSFASWSMFMQLKKFRPREAIEILLDQKRPLFFKTWALARLFTWMCLDQRPGRRNPKTGHGNRSRFRSKNAKYAGHLTIACLLDRGFQAGQIDKEDDTLRQMFKLFMSSGGFGVFIESPRGVRSLLSRAKKARKQLWCVYQITDYLCRYEKYRSGGSKSTIYYAKQFFEKARDKKYSPRIITKFWELNKQAAPYVYAFYPTFSFGVRRVRSIAEATDALEQLAANQEVLNRLLGRAAYAATILKGKARDVREKDFRNVARIEPQLAPFNVDEAQIIEGMGPKQLSKKDLKDYRPKTIARSRCADLTTSTRTKLT